MTARKKTAKRPAPADGTKPAPAKPMFFRTGEAFSRWLDRHHASKPFLLVGVYRKDTGKGGATYPELLDAALCHGWIDGVRGSLPGGVHTIRFSPRRTNSIWSEVNIRHMARLREAGRVRPHGQAVFDARDPKKTYLYSSGQRPRELPPEVATRLQANVKAWAYFTTQPPYYQRAITSWIVSAKRPETRESRLLTAIADAAAGRWHKHMKGAAAKGRKPGPGRKTGGQ